MRSFYNYAHCQSFRIKQLILDTSQENLALTMPEPLKEKTFQWVCIFHTDHIQQKNPYFFCPTQ